MCARHQEDVLAGERGAVGHGPQEGCGCHIRTSKDAYRLARMRKYRACLGVVGRTEGYHQGLQATTKGAHK